jgi:hypothetical protein
MNLNILSFPPHAFRFMGGGGGGGGGQAQAVQQAPVPTPAPPVTTSSPEVMAAQQDVLQQQMLKKSIKKTIYAGDTGGYKPQAGMAGMTGAAAPSMVGTQPVKPSGMKAY